MSLLVLPVELLEQIICDTMPLGFESFMLSCKAIYNTGAKLIEKHHYIRWKYKKLDLANSDVDCSMKLLVEIAKEPLIADYIEHADLQAAGVLEEVLRQDTEEISNLAALGERRLSQLLAWLEILDSGHIKPSRLPHVTLHHQEGWRRKILVKVSF
jgi:hypothetical protein